MAKLWICGGYKGCWICLNKSEYDLMTSQYVWTCLNNAEYGWICWHIPETTECWICQNSECVWCIIWHKVTVKVTEQLSRHCQTYKMKRFAKRIMVECGCSTKRFSGETGAGRSFVKLGHFDKDFVKDTRKRSLAGKY